MKRLVALLLSLCMLLGLMTVAVAAAPAEAGDDFAAKLEEMYASENLEIEYRPSVRWWLAEGLNTDETLKKNVQEIYDSGFGAMEILAMPEDGAPDEIYAWGSEEWSADSQLVVKEAAARGMGFALTSGTHWACANLPDTYVWEGEAFTPDNKGSNKELDYATINVAAGTQFNGVLPTPKQAGSSGCGGTTYQASTENEFVGVVAAKVVVARNGAGDETYSEGSGTGQLDFASLTDLTEKVVAQEDGTYTLDWTAPADGDYALFAYYYHGTGQTSDPSVSTNYTVNYMDSYGIEALIDYWEANILTEELRETLKASGKGEIYHDSLELSTYGAGGRFWGVHFVEEFKARMGYDIIPYLPFIVGTAGRVDSGSKPVAFDYQASTDADKAYVNKIRDDYFRVMSDLYEENFLKPLSEWLHSMNMTLRAEPSYGATFEATTSAKYVDGIETESFAQNADIDLYRGLLGGANMYGRVFSSETGAVGSHNYVFNMDQWTQLCYLQFVGGVQRTVFHGYSAVEGSEGSTSWPGHEGMMTAFSDRFNHRQPASQLYPQWTEMLTRNQKALRQGTPSRDIAILRSDYAFINYGFKNGWNNFTNNYTMHDTPVLWNDLELQHNGYTYDYFSPLLLTDEENVEWTADALQPNGPAYQAIMLYQEELEYEAALKILEIAEDGLPVVFVNNNTEYKDFAGNFGEHKVAASKSRHTSHTDAELQAVVAQIKALPNVATVESPADAMEQLQAMGVYARVGFTEPTNQVLTISRNDAENDIYYTFAHAFKFQQADAPEVNTVTLTVEGEGKPYKINDWTGEVTELAAYEFVDGRTEVTLTLNKGEAALLAFDMSDSEAAPIVSTNAYDSFVEDGTAKIMVTESGEYTTVMADGTAVTANIDVPAKLALSNWDITIQDWNKGDKVVNTEEKFGHVTTEVYFETKKTDVVFEDVTTLETWNNMTATEEQLASINSKAMSEVSGVGTYTTTFDLPEGWTADQKVLLTIGSTNGSIVMIYVNDQAVNGLDPRNPAIDISGLLVEGENTVKIVVPTTLTNRLRIVGGHGPSSRTAIQSYGLSGEVAIVPYVVADADNGMSVVLNVAGNETATVEDELTYTVSAAEAEGLATATLTFAVNAEAEVVAADGWYVISEVEEDGVITAVLCNIAGLTGEGDIASVVVAPTGKPETVTVELTKAVLSAYVGESEAFVPTVLANAAVTTEVTYSVYDVNQDGTVNQLDITRAQRFFGKSDDLADVDGSGEVDITDLVLILNNYSK